MITLRRIVLEKNTQIKNWVENCGRNGTAILNRYQLERFLGRYELTEGEFGDFLRIEYGIETIINEDHHILSRSEARKVF